LGRDVLLKVRHPRRQHVKDWALLFVDCLFPKILSKRLELTARLQIEVATHRFGVTLKRLQRGASFS
jgi:hypothetical protein